MNYDLVAPKYMCKRRYEESVVIFSTKQKKHSEQKGNNDYRVLTGSPLSPGFPFLPSKPFRLFKVNRDEVSM